MKNYINYLVRNLAIINYDGQISEYNLVYLKGKMTQHGVENVSIFSFYREWPETIFIDSLLLQEIKPGTWIIV